MNDDENKQRERIEKISFFKRMYLAITDFRMYPYTQKESFSKALGYFLKLIIFVAIIISAFYTKELFRQSPVLLDIYETYMPDFAVENGKLQCEENVEKEINHNYYLVVNQDVRYDSIDTLTLKEDDVHTYYIFALADSISLGVRVEDGIQEIATTKFESEMSFDKEQLADEWEVLQNSTKVRLFVWIGISLGTFIVLFIIKLWSLILYWLSAHFINMMFGVKLNWKKYLILVIYASTLPFILESIALIVVGGISDAVNFISILIGCVYIFYALRAIKLDTIILGTAGKNIEEKMRVALEHAQEELEKQLEELEGKKNEEKNESEEAKTEDSSVKCKSLEELEEQLKAKADNLNKAQEEFNEIIEKIKQEENKK